MSATAIKPRIRMRHGQRLSEEELRTEARQAIEHSGLTQREVARRLDVSEQAISNAVRETGTKVAALQRKVVSLLTDYTVEVGYVASRKDRS